MNGAARVKFAAETDRMAEEIVAMIEGGASAEQIAADLGYTVSALRIRMRRRGHLEIARMFERATAVASRGVCASCGASVSRRQNRCHPCYVLHHATGLTNMERIQARIKISESGCWEWQGAKSSTGYGWIKLANPRRDVATHRLVWTEINGPIPDGLMILHSCDNPPCVNPAHLSLGTHADNMLDRQIRGRHASARKTECVHGHPYDDENTIRSESGHRTCRACRTRSRKGSA